MQIFKKFTQYRFSLGIFVGIENRHQKSQPKKPYSPDLTAANLIRKVNSLAKAAALQFLKLCRKSRINEGLVFKYADNVIWFNIDKFL